MQPESKLNFVAFQLKIKTGVSKLFYELGNLSTIASFKTRGRRVIKKWSGACLSQCFTAPQ